MKRSLRERNFECIALDDFNIGGYAGTKLRNQISIDLDCNEPVNNGSKRERQGAGTRSDLHDGIFGIEVRELHNTPKDGRIG